MATASLLDCWLYWLLHPHEYEPAELLKLFPQEAIRQATLTITQIAKVTEDKAMYDSREKAIRDQQWALNASRKEGLIEGMIEGMLEGEIKGEIKGKIEGKIEMIRMLQEILNLPVSTDSDFDGNTLEELQNHTADLQDRLRNRHDS